MLHGRDIVIVAYLLAAPRESPDKITISKISDVLGMDVGSVHRSLKRLTEARLLVSTSRRVGIAQAEEFLVHGLRYVFPPKHGGEARGVPTSWAAPPLSEHLSHTNSPRPVWVHPRGQVRGVALEPLHSSVPELALRDETMHRQLALVDGLRSDETRVRRMSRELLFGHHDAAGEVDP